MTTPAAPTTRPARSRPVRARRPGSVIDLLVACRPAGVTLTHTGRHIEVDGPPAARHLVAALRADPALLAHIVHVYTGGAPVLDWATHYRATVPGPLLPCRLCGTPALLRDPYDGMPCHKTCLESALTPLTDGSPAAANPWETS